MSDNAESLRQQITAHFTPDPPARLGVAVSGGSDSTALLCLLHDWSLLDGPQLHAVTVDHGLRSESADEARAVAQLCADLGVPHDILHWHWDRQGNLPDRARRGRYALMSDWAQGQGISDIALGHTLDDQAETFLMRLARGSGLDGLSAMAPRRQHGRVTLHRPLLGVHRAELRDMLSARGVGWAEDPSNADTRYARVRARRALAALADLDITPEGLAETANRLAEARHALGHCAADAAARLVRFDAGDVLFDEAALRALPDALQRRLVQAALIWITGAEYGPRGMALSRFISGQDTTLQGCRILSHAGNLRLTREAGAVQGNRVPVGQIWDGRWELRGPGDMTGLELDALGEAGLPLCPERKATGRPAATLMASPAVWHGNHLVAAPLAGLANGWTATLKRHEDAFMAALLSH